MHPMLRLLRPKQWTKNLLVFAALMFTARFNQPEALLQACLGFVAMCLLSSSIYVVNDAMDYVRDRQHPVKRNRPIASGEVQKKTAIIYSQVLALGGAAILAWLGPSAVVVGGVYVALQALYNLRFKHVAVLDVFIISIGFVLRAVLGAAVIHATISGWLLLCTGALALTLGFGKRRAEFLNSNGAPNTRPSLVEYSRQALDVLVATSATAAALCYGVYVLESPTAKAHPALILTTPFVFYGVCRYLLLTFQDQQQVEEPESLLFRDAHLWISVALFLIVSAMAMSTSRLPWVE